MEQQQGEKLMILFTQLIATTLTTCATNAWSRLDLAEGSGKLNLQGDIWRLSAKVRSSSGTSTVKYSTPKPNEI